MKKIGACFLFVVWCLFSLLFAVSILGLLILLDELWNDIPKKLIEVITSKQTDKDNESEEKFLKIQSELEYNKEYSFLLLKDKILPMQKEITILKQQIADLNSKNEPKINEK